MLKKLLWVVTFCFIATSVAFAAPLKVWPSLLNENERDLGRRPISLHFNQPVAGLGEDTALASENCPFTITPKIAGTCRYNGAQTLTFEPNENWPAATRYTLTLPAGFTSQVTKQKLAKPYTVSFNTALVQVERTLPYKDEHWINLNPTLYVLFSMPVKEDIAKFITLTAGKKSVPVSVRGVSKEEFEKNFHYGNYENAIALVPTKTLSKGTKYTLSLLKGLPSVQGTQGLGKTYQTSFYTYPDLAVFGTTNEGCLPFTASVNFSSPVRMRELMRAVSVKPASAKKALERAALDALGYEETDKKTGRAYFRTPLTFLDFKPEQDVEVSISGDLKDIYGNTLGRDYFFVVSNQGYCPRVDFSGGLGVLESYLKPLLPVDVINITALPVEAARFNKDNFIPFDQQETKYCGQKKLANPTFAQDYNFAEVKDKTLNAFFDLRRFGVNAKDSIIFTQFKTKRRNEDCWESATDNVTDAGVTFKTSATSTLIWVTSLKEGKAMPDMPVELRDKTNRVLWTGKTGADGLVVAPGWKDLDAVAESRWQAPEIYAFVSGKGGDAVVSNKWNDGLEPWRFNLNYTYAPQRELLRGYVFTERGVYRPTEKVYIKGVVREQENGAWAVSKLKQGKVVISDARGENVWDKEVTLSKNGTFDLTYAIAKNAPTGMWNISFVPLKNGQAVEQDNVLGASFQVQAVKQTDFQVTFVPQQTQYVSGEESVYNVAANYHFGSPVTDAKAKWTLRQEYASFEPEGYKDYTFNPYFLNDDYASYNGKLLGSASGQLDANGALTLTEKLPVVTATTRVFGEVSVTSPANQELFSRNSVLVHPGDFYIGAKTPKDTDFYAGKPVTLDVIALTPQGERTATIATAKIYKYNWYSVRKTGLSGRLEWVNDKEKINLPSQKIGILPEGSQLSFTPKEGGNYYIEFTATDLEGRTIKGGTDVYVYGKDESSWRKNDDDLLVLKQDKNEYKAGQKARITLESPYPQAQALVSVERGGVLDAWVVNVEEGASFIQVPIKENYLPNVYVSVVLVRGRSASPVKDRTLDLGKPQVKVGYVNLNVIPDNKKIATAVKTSASTYQPGEEVTVQLTTKVKGKAVPAEVAVMVVDEGMLALSDYKTPDLFNYFYGAQPLAVSTMDNRAYVIGQRSFGEKGENRGGGGAAGAKLGGVDLRSNFSFVPYYQASVQTDKKGKASVSFTLPDNLTKFRVMAVALTQDEFGSGETAFTVAKPIMVTPHLPRFMRKGDEFSCAAIVYNFADKRGQLTLQAQATGALALGTPADQGIYVPLGGSRHVSWTCKATTDGKASFAVSVRGKKHSDGFVLPLEVAEVEKAQVLSAYDKLSGSEKAALLTKPANVLAQADNNVSVMLASTALLNLKSAVNFLLTYPYDCLEQKMSKILPVISSEELIKDFHLGDVTAYKKQAQEVLNEIPLYQTQSGGLSYWKNDNWPDAYVTAYALETAYEAQKAGYKVPQAELDKALAWLAAAFNKDTKQAYAYSVAETDVARAYAIYVLALYGQNVDSAFNNLYSQIDVLNVSASAYLLKTAYLIKSERSIQRALIKQLSRQVVFTSESVYMEEKPMPWLHTDSVSATALTLDALLNERNGFDYAFQMVSWLLKQMDADGHWSSTSTNALVLQALSHYYQKAESKDPEFEAFINQGYKQILLHRFKGRSLDNAVVVLPFEKIYADGPQARLTFIKHGTGTLYYTLAQRYVPAAFNVPANSGFTITRKLTTLDDKPVSEVHAGERYKVTLSVDTPVARHFVALEDFIAAGLEIVNTSLATESDEQAQALYDANRESGFFRAERYDDRLVVFADYLSAGKHEYSYIVSAVSEGVYSYPAAWVSEMYEPSVFGRTKTTQLVIK